MPTVYHVLNPKARPKVFTRSYRTEEEDYDTQKERTAVIEYLKCL